MFPEKTRILVVDDSFNHRQLITESLRRIGYKNFKAFDNAKDAYDNLVSSEGKSKNFDLIISDLNMPEITGIDFLKQVRENDLLKKLPFILITTESEKGAVIQAAMHGVSSYIVKPFSVESLTKRMKEAFKKHN